MCQLLPMGPAHVSFAPMFVRMTGRRCCAKPRRYARSSSTGRAPSILGMAAKGSAYLRGVASKAKNRNFKYRILVAQTPGNCSVALRPLDSPVVSNGVLPQGKNPYTPLRLRYF